MSIVAMLEVAHKVLSPLPKGSIVAGGAVRDAILCKRPTDLDVYVLDTESNRALLLSIYPNMALLESESVEKYEELGPWLTVFDTKEVFHGFPVQLMLIGQELTPAEAVEQTFDFGICKVYYGITEGLVQTAEFVKDATDQTLTYYPSEYAKLTQHHIDKLKVKFPGYRVIT